MKSVFVSVLTGFLFILNAHATSSPEYQALVNGTYVSFTQGLCGLHVQKDDGNLVLTYVARPGGPQCSIQGHTVIAHCYGRNCSVTYSNRDRVEVRILQSGNFLYRYAYWNSSSGTHRYDNWSTFNLYPSQ